MQMMICISRTCGNLTWKVKQGPELLEANPIGDFLKKKTSLIARKYYHLIDLCIV